MGLLRPRMVSTKNGTEVLLRSPETADAQAFIDFACQIFPSSSYLITEPDEFVPNLDRQKAFIQDLLSENGSVGIVAIHGDKIIANLDFKSNGGRRRLAHRGKFGMGVLKEWRGQGLGTLLIQTLIEWARQKDNPIEKIELGVLTGNDSAIALYKKMGFNEEGRLHRAVKLKSGEYLDEILMGLFV